MLALCPETWPKVMKAEAWPPLSETHKVKCQDWAMKYQTAEVSKGFSVETDEMKAALYEPDQYGSLIGLSARKLKEGCFQ